MFVTCAAVGVPNAARLVALMLHAMQHQKVRHSCIISQDKKRLHIHSISGHVIKGFTEDVLTSLPGDIAIGLGSYVQPAHWVDNTSAIPKAMLVGGKLFASDSWREKIPFDNEAAVWAVKMLNDGITAHPNAQVVMTRFLSQYDGVYSVLSLFDGTVRIFRDPHGLVSMVKGNVGSCGKVFATESCALDLVGARKKNRVDIKPGQWIEVRSRGRSRQGQFYWNQPVQKCSVRYLYGYRPDSIVDGLSPQAVRFKVGLQLGALLLKNKIRADVVVPAPDSGNHFSGGIAKAMNILEKRLIVRQHYLTQALNEPKLLQLVRHKSFLSVKYSVIVCAVKDQKVILVDDFINEGNVAKFLVALLREAGAAEVHLALCPKACRKCPVDLAFEGKSRFIASECDDFGIRNYTGADSVNFLPVEQLQQIVGEENHCFHCLGKRSPLFA